MIDCNKTDEIEEVLKEFRTWRLDSEEDEDMKKWIIKYKAEFVNDNIGRPTDDLYDSRELAKWYRMWHILFPISVDVVPSPCEY